MQRKTIYELEDILAEAYCEAARSRADMRATANALEGLRDQARSGAPLVEVMPDLDAEIGRADTGELASVLFDVGTRYLELAIQDELDHLGRRMDKDPEKAWSLWLRAYVDTFGERVWLYELGQKLAEYALHESPAPEWPPERIRQATRDIRYGMWPETYDWFAFLKSQEALSPEQRARLLVILAEIQLYHFYQPTKARELLEEAESLAPQDHRVTIGWGEYWFQINELEEARDYFVRVISEKPELADGYVNLGDYYMRVGQLDDAENQYELAIVAAPGQIEGHRALHDWCGRPEVFEGRRDQREQLFERMRCLSRFEPRQWIYRGAVYRSNRDYAEAHRCFRKAQDGDPEYPLAYSWIGSTYLDQAKQAEQEAEDPRPFYDKAKAQFDLLIEKAPDALQGLLSYTQLHTQRQDWENALETMQTCLGLHPECESYLLSEQANVRRQMGQLDEAEKDLMRSLEMEPHGPGSLNVLSSLAEDYRNRPDYPAAARALEVLRQHKGDTYEHTYQNRMGHLFYDRQEYDQAAEHYRKAIAARPEDHVLNSNLALALERLHVPGRRLQELDEAIEHLQTAIELAPSDESYRRRLAKLETERRLVDTYGEGTDDLVPVASRIRVWLEDDVLPDILDPSEYKLSKETMQAAEDLREDIRQRFGIAIPGIRFGTDQRPGNGYRIVINEAEQDRHSVEPGRCFSHLLSDRSPWYSFYFWSGEWVSCEKVEPDRPDQEIWTVTEFILRHVQHILELDLSKLLGYQETYNLLVSQESPVCQRIQDDPRATLDLMQVLKKLLSDGISVADFEDLCQAFYDQRQAGHSLEAIAEELSLTLAHSR